jgi:hypothetical protein
MNLSLSGNLLMQVPNGTFELKKPTIYQDVHGTRRLVAGKFTIRNHDEVALDVGDYDPTQALVIDPVLSYSTLIGANNGTTAQALGVDSLGNVYITGTTFATNYPTVSAFQGTNNGTTNVFVTKLNAAGNTILYSTYLGGSGFPGASAIAVDGAGNAYVTGIAAMSDFPTTPGAFMTTCPGGFCNAPFVAKFLSNGTLSYSTFMGGSNTPVSGIAIDSLGEVYITGLTASNDLPTTPGSFEPNYPSTICSTCAVAYVEKLNALGSSLVYSTYFASPGNFPSSAASGIAVDKTGSAYIVGTGTVPTLNALETGPAHGFLAKFTPDGSALMYSTYLGGSGTDNPTAVAVDALGNAHVAGTSTSCDFPLLLSAFSTDCAINSGSQPKVFALTVSASGSQLLFSTFLGDGAVGPVALAVDKSGNTYVTGSTLSSTFPALKAIETTSQRSVGSVNFSAFVTELSPAGNLLFSTYLAGQGGSIPGSIAVDGKRAIYVAGTGNYDFPLLHPIAAQVKNFTGYQIFAVKILPARNAPQFSLSPRISPILSLRNVSSVPLNISSMIPSANFVKGGDCGATLAPGTGCTLILQGAADKKTTGSVVITSDAYATPQKLIITKSPIGDSVGALVQIVPDALEFAPQFVGTSSAAQPLIVRNVGLQPSALGSIDIFGDFIQTNNCPAVLSAGAFCTISVVYQPASTGNGFGQLGVTHDQFTDTVFLNGVSSSSAIAASTTNVQFATQFVGSTSLARIVNLTNTTPYPATVSGLATSAGFAQTNTCTAPVAPHGACRVSITYTPTGNQDATGTLTASNFGPGGAQVVNLLATGLIAADLGVSPLTLTIQTALGVAGQFGTVTLSNTSQKLIPMGAIQTSAPFSQTNTCPATLGASGSCQIFVSYNATQPGSSTGMLQIAFTGTGSPQLVGLTGTARTIVDFFPAAFAFGQQKVNTTSAQGMIFVENPGLSNVTISSIKVQGTEFRIAQNNCSGTLAPFAACSLGIVFTPGIIGVRSGTLSVLASDFSQPHLAQLQGIGVGAGRASVAVSSLNFAPQTVGTTSAAQLVTVTNTGSGKLNFTGISASPNFFLVTNQCATSLAAGAHCSVSVRFAPTIAGMLVGSLTIADDGLASPHAVALSGIGQ